MMKKLLSPLLLLPLLHTHIQPSTITTMPTSVPAPQNTPHHIPSPPMPMAALAVAIHDDSAIPVVIGQTHHPRHFGEPNSGRSQTPSWFPTTMGTWHTLLLFLIIIQLCMNSLQKEIS